MAKNNVSIQEGDEENLGDEYYELYADQNTANLNKNPFLNDGGPGGPISSSKVPMGKIEYLHDIEVELVVRFGQIKMTLNDILNIKKSSICILNKIVGEPIEIFIGDRIMARGEVVVVNERFGVRLSEVVRPDDRGQMERNAL